MVLSQARADRSRGAAAGLSTPDRRRATEELWLDSLIEVADSISSAEGIDKALNRLAWLALKSTGADRSAILVPDKRDPREVQPAAGASRIGDLTVLWERFRSMEPINVETDLHHPSIWESTQATVIEDVASSKLVPESWKRSWDLKSIAYAPLRAGGEMFGILAVDYSTLPHRFSPEEVKLLEAIAAAAGVALRSAALVERLQHSVSVERRLSECSAALLAGRSLDEILGEIAERFASLLPGSACGINLLSADGMVVRLAAWRGLPPPNKEVRIVDLPESRVAQIKEAWKDDARRVIVVPDVAAIVELRPFIPEGIGTGMLVPLVEGKETLGFVAVGREAVPFNDDEVRVASAFADQAAVALVQARLTEALHLRLGLVEALSRLDDAVVHSTNVVTVLRRLNRCIGRDIGIRCTRLAFADRALGDLLKTAAPRDDEVEQIREWRQSQRPKEERHGDLLSVPVSIHGRVAGILWVRADPVDAVRLELIKAMAAAIGEVAYKAKLRQKAERSAQELAVVADRERIAHDLHDTVGQTLYGIGLNLQDLLYDVTDPDQRERLAALRMQASRGVADVRSAVYALSFVHLRDRGLVPSIQELVREFTQTTDVYAQLRLSGPLPVFRDDVQSTLYRIAHEALVNVERHARATGVVLSIVLDQDWVELSVRDDGVGLDQREARDWRVSAHFGMRMMAKSVEDLGGFFHAAPTLPRGFHIRAKVPIAPVKSATRRPWKSASRSFS